MDDALNDVLLYCSMIYTTSTIELILFVVVYTTPTCDAFRFLLSLHSLQ